MKKFNKTQDNMEKIPDIEQEELLENTNEECDSVSLDSESLNSLKMELQEKSKKCEEYFTSLQRAIAEFDNYKKRTSKEKSSLYSEAVTDVVSEFLPVLDNIERATQVSEGDTDNVLLREGVELVYRQFKDIMNKLGVEEIKCVGENFDPKLHNAVMHIEDDSYAENIVVEEFQKGYILKEKVIRHSMVKVVN